MRGRLAFVVLWTLLPLGALAWMALTGATAGASPAPLSGRPEPEMRPHSPVAAPQAPESAPLALPAPAEAPNPVHRAPQRPTQPISALYLPIRAKVTGYCPCARCCGADADRKTATMRSTDVHRWGLAADPALLPYGTRVVVPGYLPTRHRPDSHPWEVDDTGGAMRRSGRTGVIHIDLRFIHHRSATRWGERWMTVYVLRSSIDEFTARRLVRIGGTRVVSSDHFPM